MVRNSQRTIYGLALQMAQIIGAPYTILPNTTLNEKFDILKDTALIDGVYPTVEYFGIGVGGGKYVDSIGSYSFSKHQPIDAALFEQIPYIMRLTTNDLLPADQLKYRFKKTIIVQGVEYYAYYLKKIDNTLTKKDIYTVTVTDSVAKLSKFNNNIPELLNPVPRDPSVGLLNTDVTSYVSIITKLKFELLTSELDEIYNVINILYGTNSGVNITEIAVCSGVETPVTDGTEAANVQILYHFEVDTLTAIEKNNTKDLIRSLEIGGMEPLVLT